MAEALKQLKQMQAILKDDIAKKNAGLEGEPNTQVVVTPKCVKIKILDKYATCKNIVVNYKIKNMKKYIGTKQVEAEPMTLGDFVQKTGRNPYGEDIENHEETEQGYHVRYEDGYESWSPKDVFEKSYNVADTHLDRMNIESRELNDKSRKLSIFIDSEKFNELDNITQGMLKVQRRMMYNYWQILNHRATKMETGLGGSCSLNFGQAIEYLKAGLAVRREGWNGKGLWVIKQVPAHITEEIIPKMQSLPQSAKDLVLKGKGFIDYTSQCLIYNENTGRADSWVPSISDVFAEDWEIVID